MTKVPGGLPIQLEGSYLLVPDLHDSRLVGVALTTPEETAPESLLLTFVEPSQARKITLVLPRLSHMLVENYSENNVIFEVKIIPTADASEAEIRRTCSLKPDEPLDGKSASLASSSFLHLSTTHMSSRIFEVRAIFAGEIGSAHYYYESASG